MTSTSPHPSRLLARWITLQIDACGRRRSYEDFPLLIIVYSQNRIRRSSARFISMKPLLRVRNRLLHSAMLLRPAEQPTLLCAFPLRHQRSMRALAIPLEICNGFKLLRKSDIFIVRVWNNGQPLTIIRRIFLNDVCVHMVNLYDITFSNFLSGALKHRLDTCMTCASSEK